MNDDELDGAIDRVAEGLTGRVPAHGLAERVRGRIEGRSRPVGWAWSLAGALMLVALVAYATWPAREVPTDLTVTRATAPPAAGPPPARGPAEPGPRVSAGGSRPSAIRGRTATARVGSVPDATLRVVIDSEVPQLAAIPEIPHLSLPALGIAELTIAPLEPEKESR